MDSKEADVYLETAKDQLEDAELAFKEGRYALCTFLCALSGENAASALLTSLGAKPSKKHRNSLVLNRLVPTVTREIQPILRQMVGSMKTLEPHITKARYPVLKGLELIPPSKFYTKDAAEKALLQAKSTVENSSRGISIISEGTKSSYNKAQVKRLS